MRLLIDAGNTRIKWAVVDAGEWTRSGVLPVEQAGDLAQQFADVNDIQQIWASNVAGAMVERHIRNVSAVQLRFIVAQSAQCGVTNGYDDAAQLGCDRWAALIAAWHLVRGGCLVVNCGTATTIDTLSAQGEFLGGLIMPGMELMQRSLVAATDQLRPGSGEYMPIPRNTADALYSGAIQATCGAIERQHAMMGDGSAPVLLSGGAAGVLQQHIKVPVRVVENLVLQGLLLIAQEANE